MNIIKNKTISLVLGTLILSSTATLLVSQKIWREIPDSQAKKQSLNIKSWAPLIEKSQPAVVVITTEAIIKHPPVEFPGLPGPFKFFMPIPPEKQQGQGSGFIINEEGYILTNHHVIDGAQKIKVTVGHNPKEYEAEIIGSDEPLDIALLKLKLDKKEKSTKWPYLPLGCSDDLRLGDPVIALGSPLGLVQSVNVGIVSHKHRGNIRPSGKDLDVEMLQLQVPINPGNSGGPILDDSGRVIAISESILASGQVIAFGLPIDVIKLVLPQLVNKGLIERAFLGVTPTDLTPKYAKELGLSQNEKGAVIVEVLPNTPAYKAGLRPMDVILEIDSKRVNDSFNLRYQAAYKNIGQKIKLKLFRKDSGIKYISVKLAKRPGETVNFSKPEQKQLSAISIDSVGLVVIDTPKDIQSSLNLKKPGAQIISVKKYSPADYTSLETGDVITKVSGIDVESAKHLQQIIKKAPKQKTLMMLTRRGRIERFVSLEKK